MVAAHVCFGTTPSPSLPSPSIPSIPSQSPGKSINPLHTIPFIIHAIPFHPLPRAYHHLPSPSIPSTLHALPIPPYPSPSIPSASLQSGSGAAKPRLNPPSNPTRSLPPYIYIIICIYIYIRLLICCVSYSPTRCFCRLWRKYTSLIAGARMAAGFTIFVGPYGLASLIIFFHTITKSFHAAPTSGFMRK